MISGLNIFQETSAEPDNARTGIAQALPSGAVGPVTDHPAGDGIAGIPGNIDPGIASRANTLDATRPPLYGFRNRIFQYGLHRQRLLAVVIL